MTQYPKNPLCRLLSAAFTLVVASALMVSGYAVADEGLKMPTAKDILEASEPESGLARAYRDYLANVEGDPEEAHRLVFPVLGQLVGSTEGGDQAEVAKVVEAMSEARRQRHFKIASHPFYLSIWQETGFDPQVAVAIETYPQLVEQLAELVPLAVDGPLAHFKASSENLYGGVLKAILSDLAHPSDCRLAIYKGLAGMGYIDGPDHLRRFQANQAAVEAYYEGYGRCDASTMDEPVSPNLGQVLAAIATSSTFARERPKAAAEALSLVFDGPPEYRELAMERTHGLKLLAALHSSNHPHLVRDLQVTFARLPEPVVDWPAQLMAIWGDSDLLRQVSVQLTGLTSGQRRQRVAASMIGGNGLVLASNAGVRELLASGYPCSLTHLVERPHERERVLSDKRLVNKTYETGASTCKPREGSWLAALPLVGAMYVVANNLYHNYPVTLGEVAFAVVDAVELAGMVVTFGGSAAVTQTVKSVGKIAAKQGAKESAEAAAKQGVRRAGRELAEESAERGARRLGRESAEEGLTHIARRAGKEGVEASGKKAGRAGQFVKAGLSFVWAGGKWTLKQAGRAGAAGLRTGGSIAKAMHGKLLSLSPLARRRFLTTLFNRDLAGRAPMIADASAVTLNEWTQSGVKSVGNLFLSVADAVNQGVESTVRRIAEQPFALLTSISLALMALWFWRRRNLRRRA